MKVLLKRIFSRKLVLLYIAALLTVFAALSKGDTKTLGVTSQGAANWKDAPEMGEILGSDQTTRLKATRKLVERVGVEEALEILEASTLPHTGEGHLAVHQIGFFAYQEYGTEAILKCKDYFLYACYHGVIIESATDAGFDGIIAMRDACRGTSPRFFQCSHAIGHSLLATWNYDLPEALKDCDKVFGDEKQFPDGLTSCHNGAFMENLFGVHDWGTGKEQVRDWLSDDPYFPCNAFEEKYQKGCWLNQAARIYVLENGDIVKTKEVCEGIGNEQYTHWCIDNLARQIHPMTLGDVGKVFELCAQVGEFWREMCIVVNAGSFYSVGDPDTAIEVCNQPLSVPAKADCYQRILGQLVPDVNLTYDQKEEYCKKMQGNFIGQCLEQIRT